MILRSPGTLALAVLAACGVGSGMGLGTGTAAADTPPRVSGPHLHENLAIYFIHDTSAAGAVPLTLDEALANGKAQVTETGQVNELKVENTGEEEVFIQAGDIVKGGRQDRVLTVSLLLPPRSGQVPIASFCVEAGRWSSRGGEDVTRFTSAAEAMPSRKALLAMAAPPAAEPPAEPVSPQGARPEGQRLVGTAGLTGTASRQRQVWDSVAKTQERLKASLGAPVQAPQSATSLQLSLESGKLKEGRAAYLAALGQAGLADGDVVGFVAAINGKPVSANAYPSNGLFRKLWAKQLAAVVTEAIGDKPPQDDTASPAAPSLSEVQGFLAAAEQGRGQERVTTADMRQETREAERALYNEARKADGSWVHRNYLAK